MNKLLESCQAAWEVYSLFRAKQIARWLDIAREVRGSEFTAAKQQDWLNKELAKDTIVRLSLGL